MATPAQWIEGARPRTLPAAIAPVLAATAVVAYFHAEVWWKAALAMVVSLLLQVGVNYANDYSDGIRGTDDDRVGPMRLVGSGAAPPSAVKRAAFAALGLAAVVGLVLAVTTAWWLVAVGAVSILAAWFYTGGSKPYGYLGLGEVMVFCFFGLVAVLGTVYVQAHGNTVHGFSSGSGFGWDIADPWPAAWCAAVGVGAIACAILVANNLRDIPTDVEAGKMTLAVRLGDRRTRAFYALLVLVALAGLVGVALTTSLLALVALVAFVPLGRAAATVLKGAAGPGLIPVLQLTGVGELVYGAALLIGLLVAR
ncbi:MAG TPA: 1,4-dihydroxy-2-naphthoate polyprenyltransferase [Marmoricola sp.]